MLAGPFPAELVINRLRTLDALRMVDGAVGLEQALKVPPRAMPAAFVVMTETGRQPADYSDAYAQPMDVSLIVVLWLAYASLHESGSGASDAMTVLERQVRNSLRTWSPPSPFEPLWVANSGADAYLGGHLTRQVIFRTQYRDQEVA